MKNYFSILVLLLLFSCGDLPKEQTEEEAEANLQFFDVVYKTQASKITGQNSWTAIQGDQKFKFVQGSGNDPGNFTVSFTTYREPQLVSDICSGGFSGTFVIDSEGETTTTAEENSSYNPLDPYYPDGEPPTTGTDTEVADDTATILVYTFSMTVPNSSENRSMTAGCRNIPESFQFKAVRFQSGDVLLTDIQRDIDYYLIPEIIE